MSTSEGIPEVLILKGLGEAGLVIYLGWHHRLPARLPHNYVPVQENLPEFASFHAGREQFRKPI